VGLTIAIIALTVGTVFYVIQPVLNGRSAPLERRADEPSEVEARKRVALLALRDVEYDFATGKLDDGDYEELRGELAAEALEAMRLEEAAAATPTTSDAGTAASAARDAIEEEIARYRAALKAGTACPECRQVNEPGSRFCANCGFSLAAAPAVASSTSEAD
jgi:hypothetical protein